MKSIYFPSLFFISTSMLCTILFACFGLWTREAVGRKAFWCSLTAVIFIPYLYQALFFETYTMSPKGLLLFYHTLACDWASGYATHLFIVKSHQFQLSVRPHCYWYKTRALKTQEAGVSGNLTDGGLITSQNTSVLSKGLKDPAD